MALDLPAGQAEQELYVVAVADAEMGRDVPVADELAFEAKGAAIATLGGDIQESIRFTPGTILRKNFSHWRTPFAFSSNSRTSSV
jgi:hypothetical protein